MLKHKNVNFRKKIHLCRRIQQNSVTQIFVFLVGIIPGVTWIYSQQLDMQEIYELGYHAYNMKDFFHARDWMRTALQVMGNKTMISGVEKSSVLDYLAFSEFKVIVRII